MAIKSKLQNKQDTLKLTDLNHNYSGRAWFGDFYRPGMADEIQTTNPAIATGWLGLLSVMAQAQIDIDEQGARSDIAEFLRKMFFKRMARRFNAVFLDLLQALIYGVQPFEVLTEYSRGKYWIVDLVPIPARNFELETLEKRPGEWWATGYCMTDRGRVKCGGPGSGDALVFWPTFGPGLCGRPIVRPILNEHSEKSYIRQLRSVGLAKSVLGTITAFERQPNIQAGETNLTNDQLMEQGQKLAEACEASDQSAIVFPSQIEKIQPIYPAADSVAKTIDAENHTDLQILQAFGSQHLARGLLSGYSSQGAGETDSKAQQALRGYYFQWAASALQPLIDWIIDLNFGAVDDYPELSIISPSPQSPESLIRSYCQLVAAGAVKPTDKDDEYLRRLLRLPSGGNPILDPERRNILARTEAPRVPGSNNGILDTRDRTNEYQELKGEQ